MATESEKTAPSRSELERIAFGRAQTPGEIAAAEAALKLLVSDDEAHAAAVAPPAQDVPPEPAPVEPESPDAGVEERAPRPRRRSVVPLVVAAGLVAALVLGVVLSHQSTVSPTAAHPSGTATGADATAALKSLLVTQTDADKSYPLPGYSAEMSIQPASIHRILTSSDGATLWTGRTDNDLCLMWTGTDPTAAIGAGISCAAPGAFDAGGLRLSEGITSWTWNGKAFTTTVSSKAALAPW